MGCGPVWYTIAVHSGTGQVLPPSFSGHATSLIAAVDMVYLSKAAVQIGTRIIIDMWVAVQYGTQLRPILV